MHMKKKDGTWTLSDGDKDLTSGSLKHVMTERERRKKKKKPKSNDKEEPASRPTKITGVY